MVTLQLSRRAHARLSLVAALAFAALPFAGAPPAVATGPAGPPLVTFAPPTIAPGAIITVRGTRFNPANGTATIAVVGENGQRTTLGYAGLSTGSFSRSVTVPASLAPGLYGVSVFDFGGQLALNLTGTLSLAPPTPFFQFQPTTVAPGASIVVTATNFSPTSNTAVVSLLDGSGHATTIGTAPIAAGGFARAFTVPAAMTLGSYGVVVQNTARQRATSSAGPLTVSGPVNLTTIPAGFYPEGVAVDAVLNRVYVPYTAVDRVAIIDGSTNTVIAAVPVGTMPCAIAANADTHRVYVANVDTNDVSVLDGRSGNVVATVPVGGYPCAIGVVRANNRIFVGNGLDNTVSVLDGASNTVIDIVPVGRAPFGIGVNQTTGRVYVANGYDNSVSVIDGRSDAVLSTVPVGRLPDAVGVNPQTNRIYVGNYHSITVTVLDGSTNASLATIPVGFQPDAIDAVTSTNHIYVANYASNTVSIVDGASNRVISTIPVGVTPDGLAANPSTGQVYVANSNSNTVAVLQDGALSRSRQPGAGNGP
jgi:YVTN family beta-propeller protein